MTNAYVLVEAPIMAKRTYTKEYKSIWIDNEEGSINKRIKWMRQRHWVLIALEVSSSSPGKMHLKFRRG